MFNTDTVNDRITAFTRLPDLRQAGYQVLSAVDTLPPELRYLGPASVFVVMAQQLVRDPHHDIAAIRRMVAAAEGPFTDHFQAMRDYTRGELLKN